MARNTQKKNRYNKVTHQNLYQSLLHESLAAVKSSDFHQAIEKAKKAIQINQYEAAGFHVLAFAFDKSGRQEEAYKIMRDNASNHSTNQYWLYLGELAANQSDYANAIGYFERIVGGSSEETISALSGLEYCYGKTHRNFDQYFVLKKISKLKELNVIQINAMASIISNLSFLNCFDDALKDYQFLLTQKVADKRRLSSSCARLMMQYLQHLYGDIESDFPQSLYKDKLFWSIFSEITLPNIEIERLMVKVRRNILLDSMSQGKIEDDQLYICQQIAAQGRLTEFIAYQATDEREIIEGLISALAIQVKASAWKPEESEALFWLISMYGYLYSLPYASDLYQIKLSSWPVAMHALLEQSLFNHFDELESVKYIETLTEIHAHTPLDVRQQYEENPYPQWQSVHFVSIGSIGRYIQFFYPAIDLPDHYFNGRPRILIAGCGTGVQAITASQQNPDSEIIAIDISLRSLAYAKRKAAEHNCNNLRFYHADILSLDSRIGEFDQIECCGVLHHLRDPITGWKRLLERLSPKGVMRIDLYSRYARESVTRAKAEIAQIFNEMPSLEKMRIFRQAQIAKNKETQLFLFRDFFNASEYRDLIFHSQETQYDLMQIKDILSALDLRFVAMHAEANKQQIFRKEFPDGNILDIELWHQVENRNPHLFYDMYAFWCARK